MSKLIRLIESANEVQSQDINDKCPIGHIMKQYDARQKTARICVKQISVNLNDKVFILKEF